MSDSPSSMPVLPLVLAGLGLGLVVLVATRSRAVPAPMTPPAGTQPGRLPPSPSGAPAGAPEQSDGLSKVIGLGKDAIRFGEDILKTVQQGQAPKAPAAETPSKAPPPPDEPDPSPVDDLVDGTGRSKSLPDPDAVATPD